MCGIFGYIGKRNNAGKIVLEGLKSLEYRGYDSWGISAVKCNACGKKESEEMVMHLIKQTGKIGDASFSNAIKSHFALGHTRWATHGGVTKRNAHPHLDCDRNLAIIHNGIIENYEEIKRKILLRKHQIKSETDSEIAIHLIEEQNNFLLAKELIRNKDNISLEKQRYLFREAVRISFNMFAGLNAIIVMDRRLNMFIAAKNGSPLVIGMGVGENFIASDAHAILPYTREIYFMEDGELITETEDKIEAYQSLDGKKKPIKFSNISWNIAKVDKGRYSHFMLKEINEQPKIIRQIAKVRTKEIEEFIRLIRSSFGTYFLGCGTASYACLAGTYIFSKISKRHINYSAGSEFGYLVDFLTPKSLIVAFSQSGETIDVIDAVKRAKEKGAKISAFVNVLGSTLFRLADHKVLLGAGVEKAVVSTKAFTAKLGFLIFLSHLLVEKKKQGEEILTKSAFAIEQILLEPNLKKIRLLVTKIHREKHIYIIGRGLSYPIALETALKIKEASYIHAEGFAAGELKHGVIALIEKGTPCISFLPEDETYGATLAGTMEMKARGGYIIGISTKNHEIFDYFLPIIDSGIGSCIPSVVIGQLLGYYLAIEQGLDPDKPRNLAKSVTVK